MKWIPFFPFVNICHATRNVFAILRLRSECYRLWLRKSIKWKYKSSIPFALAGRSALSTSKQSIATRLYRRCIEKKLICWNRLYSNQRSNFRVRANRKQKLTMSVFAAAESVSVALIWNFRCSAPSDFMFGIPLSIPLEPSWTSFSAEIAHYFRSRRAVAMVYWCSLV